MSKSFKLKNLIVLLILISVVLLGLLKVFNKTWNPIESDGVGYYVYLPQILVNHDINGLRIAEYVSYEDLFDAEPRLIPIENGNRLNKYPVGESVMILPFFLIAEGINRLFFSYQINQFGSIYEILVSISSIVYLVVGINFLWRVLIKRFSSKVSFTSLLLLGVGTNLIHYTVFDASFSHIYSFVLFSIFLFLIDNFERYKLRKIYWLSLGLIFGLTILVRQTNAIIILLLIFPFLRELKNIKLRPFIFSYFNKSIIFLIATISVFSIQMIYWVSVSGHPLMFSYIGETFNFLNPEILSVLFSARKGLLFWTPLLFVLIPGFYLFYRSFKKRADNLFIPVSIIIILQIYIVASWWAWSYGYSFGHRAFTEFLSLLVVPFAYIINFLVKNRRKTYVKIIWIIILILILINIFQMHQYWRGLINPDGMTLEMYIKIFMQPCVGDIDFLRCDWL